METAPARIDPAGRASLDERFAVASLAAASERENRPRHLVLVAVLLLAGALIYLGVEARERGTAQRQWKSRVAEADHIRSLVAELRELDKQVAENAEGAGGVGQPINVLSRLETYAAEAGLREELSHQRGPGRNEGAATLYTYPYSIRDPSLEAVMTWLSKSLEGIPGLEVQSVRLRPEATHWSVNVTLSRWERVQ